MSKPIETTRKIIHIDMDCFYAAIEERDDPSLRGKPLAVGGTRSQRGVLCTCNYIAREYGIHSAMPTHQALKLCPQLILRPVDMSKYRQVSQQIRQIFADYTHLIEPLSLDEAFLDVTQVNDYHNSATLIAGAIKQTIAKELKLTASAGVAPNKFLAKIASDWQKPNGLFVIPPTQVTQFIKRLPVNKLFGVGKVTAQKLNTLGWYTCGDLQAVEQKQLIKQFGKIGQHLFNLSHGIDQRPVNPERERKSISVEMTFTADQKGLTKLTQHLIELYAQLQYRLARQQVTHIKQQFIKIKFNDFKQTTVSRSCQLLNQELFLDLLKEGVNRQDKSIRLLGIGVRLAPAAFEQQLELEI